MTFNKWIENRAADMRSRLPDDPPGWSTTSMRAAFEAGESEGRSENMPTDDLDMPLEQAIHLAGLWRAGKMIGGDAHACCVALLGGLETASALVREALALMLEIEADNMHGSIHSDFDAGRNKGIEDSVAAIRARGGV